MFVEYGKEEDGFSYALGRSNLEEFLSRHHCIVVVGPEEAVTLKSLMPTSKIVTRTENAGKVKALLNGVPVITGDPQEASKKTSESVGLFPHEGGRRRCQEVVD